MDYMTLKEAGQKWNVTPRQVNYLCSGGRIPGAVKMAGVWLIPKNAEKPIDGRTKQLSFSDLPQMEMDKLCVVDHYPSDRFTFSSHGYDLHIENELVADAFAGLSVQEQSILILHFVLDLPDQEVGRLVGMSRSAVQRRRAKSLTELRIKLAALMPKGG